MEVNEAPEKLYCCDKGNGNLFVDYRQFPNDESIEYTRTDAFIEKVEEYIYKQLNEGRIECGDIEKFIDEIKNYMKGE